MPGAPQEVVVNAINSTTIHIRWKPPADKDLNGVIRGYQVHVQEAHESQEVISGFSHRVPRHGFPGIYFSNHLSISPPKKQKKSSVVHSPARSIQIVSHKQSTYTTLTAAVLMGVSRE